MRVSLSNALVAITVHLSRIEKEMARRGVSFSYLGSFSNNTNMKTIRNIHASGTLETDDSSYNQPETEVSDFKQEGKQKRAKARS